MFKKEEEIQRVIITLEEYKALLLAYAQLQTMLMYQQTYIPEEEPKQKKMGFHID